MPEVAAKAPKYRKELDIFIQAFYNLTNDRLNSYGTIGSIPFVSMVKYCEWIGIKDQQEFINILQHCDQVYVNTVRKQQEKEHKKASRQHGRNRKS